MSDTTPNGSVDLDDILAREREAQAAADGPALGINTEEIKRPKRKPASKRTSAKKEDKEDTAGPTRKRTPSQRKLKDDIAQVYGAIGLALLASGDAESGQAFLTNAEPLADAWIDLAEKDANVKRVLERLTTGSAWSAVIAGHIGLFLPILASKGWLPKALQGPAEMVYGVSQS